MDGVRDWLLRRLVLAGVALVVMTEALGSVEMIRRWPLVAGWVVVLGALAVVGARPSVAWRWDPVVGVCCAGIAVVLGLTLVTAWFSPPNSSDAMAYHMPRVVYWAEQASVRFFPTPYLNQIMLQPCAEYAMLHTFVISGGDGFVNFVQWMGSAASVVGVSCVARTLGAGARGQALAALFCATAPAGVLASSGAKNDYWMAMWMVAAIYFAWCFARGGQVWDALLMGCACGLALLTKAPAYLFLPWVLLVVLLGAWRWRHGLVIAGCVALALNAPQFARNYDLSGSVMGFDSAHGDGVYRWRNETFGWRETASNFLRHASEQLGGRSEAWNRGVYRAVVAAHGWIGMNVNDPRTTWHDASFAPPKNANHETDSPSRWHLVILMAAACVVAWRRDWRVVVYFAALVMGFVVFCAYLKWQPFMARLVMPLFVLGAPVVGVVVGRWRGLVQVVVCLFLLSVARLPAVENWVRPLKGPRSVLRVAREEQYFADMGQWGNTSAWYRETVEDLRRLDCGLVGIDATNFQLEYPLMALLRERRPNVRFVHAGVGNASAKYRPPVSGRPCAVVTLTSPPSGKFAVRTW